VVRALGIERYRISRKCWGSAAREQGEEKGEMGEFFIHGVRQSMGIRGISQTA
jgi:hypothetical protein